jgi:hypothetical protein
MDSVYQFVMLLVVSLIFATLVVAVGFVADAAKYLGRIARFLENQSEE